jgi:periplasmic protein TonB
MACSSMLPLQKPTMNAATLTSGSFERDSFGRLGSRGVSFLLIAAGHVGLIYAIANLSRVVPALEAVPILAEILPEVPREREAPPPPQPKFEAMELPAMEPPVVQIAQEAPTKAITMVVAETPPVADAAPRAISEVAYVKAPSPKYPNESRRRGEEGMVVLRVIIDENGRANRIEIQRSSGHSRLDDAARAAVQSAIFRPYIENGVARAVLATIPIEFTWRSRRAARGG